MSEVRGFDLDFIIEAVDGRLGPEGEAARYFAVSAYAPSRKGRIYLSINQKDTESVAQCLVTPRQIGKLRDFLDYLLTAEPWKGLGDE